MTEKKIRNFCIIAHIDHGKSTLADRLLEKTNSIATRDMKDQLLDQMDIERERGITIKLQPVRMIYINSGIEYELNLIDTPGHVDFSYEVSRSLAACEGAVLLVDSTQGIEAQTLANVYLALEHNLTIIPVINKIDLPNSDINKTIVELENTFGFKREEMTMASGKTGQGVEELLEEIVEKIPAPNTKQFEETKALIFDSNYDIHRGVITYVKIVSGAIKTKDLITTVGSRTNIECLEVGFFKPKMTKTDKLEAGEVGYIVTGLRDVSKAPVGDTITLQKEIGRVQPLPGYKKVTPMVFASIFPVSGDDYESLRDAMNKLKLNDASLEFEPEHIPSIGFGFRTGFLGLLHMEIVQERIFREYDIDIVLTAPSVSYEVELTNGEVVIVKNPASFPEQGSIKEIREPWMKVNILTPSHYMGNIMEIVTKKRGIHQDIVFLSDDRVELIFEMPLANIIIDFYDRLKSVSSGYASLNYEYSEMKVGELTKLDILVANEPVEALSIIVHKSDAIGVGRELVSKLKNLIPRQQFEISIQAALNAKIIARENISALRKDVTGYLYGGDVTRKMKLLNKQKKGKKKMKRIGKVDIPQDAFLAIMKK